MKQKALIRYSALIFGLIALNFIAGRSFFRWDLTEDKRYSISESSKAIVEKLEEPVYVKVYLHGNFPAELKELERNIRETLDELKAYGGANLKFSFIDPTAIADKDKRGELYKSLAQMGIKPSNFQAREEGKSVERIVFPGAVLTYKNGQMPVVFLSGTSVSGNRDFITQAIEQVEYKLVSAIHTLSSTKRSRVAFIDGHGELEQDRLISLISEMGASYEVGFLNLSTIPKIEGVDAVIVAKPQRSFTESDKYKLDQFIMNGGKAMFFIDAVESRRDTSGLTGLPYDLNLRDLLFRYGVRANEDLIQSLPSGSLPIKVGNQYRPVPWAFHPLLNPQSSLNPNDRPHPIVRNLGPVLAKDVSTLDTITAKGVTKTPLLFRSQYTKVKGQPIFFSVEELRFEPQKEQFLKGAVPVAFLLEGNFTSFYKGRPTPMGAIGSDFKPNSEGKGKIIVVSDGDMLANDIDYQSKRPLPLGYDKYTGTSFGNKDFVLNSLNYLLDNSGIIDLRTKVIEERPLDALCIKDEGHLKWQLLNLGLPILLVLLFGIIRFFVRKKQYASFK